ncbi:MAG: hypothetical protein PHX43_06385 [Alphaproteobacteria bacterium]|nr:hypothetical protein [Alphaproteobacteria bacterium]
MSSSKAIIIGAVLIAASVFVVNGSHTATASSGGPYQLMHHSNTSANAGVFRLDVNSGEISYCYLPGTNQLDIVCSKSVR